MADRLSTDNGFLHPTHPVRFGPFFLDPRQRELLVDGEPIALEKKAFDVLTYLLAHADKVITKDELWHSIWDGRDISESVIPQAIGKARKALGEHSEWIATVHGVGYRFTGTVQPHAHLNASTPDNQRRHVLIVAFVVAALVLLGLFAIPEDPPADPSRVAVLPFVNLSADPELDYFGDGMAEELLHELAALEELQVASRISSFRFRADSGDDAPDVQDIGRQLNVRYVVEGSVRLTDNDFRMAVRLTDAATGYQVWSGVFDGPWEDLLTTQQALTRSVIEQIRPQLLPKYAVSTGMATNPRAYELYLRGRYLWHKRDPESLTSAMSLFREAAREEPQFAMAYTGLAECYLTLVVYGAMKPEEAYSEAKQLLGRAVELAPDRAETRMALGNLYALQTDWQRAEAELLTAVAINPDLAMAQMSLGTVYNELGDMANAYQRFRIALQRNPLHATIFLNLAQASLKLGMFERSHAYLDRAEALSPDHTFLFGLRTVVLISEGNTPKLADLLDRWLEQRDTDIADKDPDNLNRHIACAMAATYLNRPDQVIECASPLITSPVRDALGAQYLLLTLNSVAWAYTQLGDTDAASQFYGSAQGAATEFLSSQSNSEILTYEYAVTLAGLGNYHGALEQLTLSARLGRRDIGLMRHDRRLDALRDHQGFQTLMGQLTAEQAQMRAQVLQKFPRPAQ